MRILYFREHDDYRLIDDEGNLVAGPSRSLSRVLSDARITDCRAVPPIEAAPDFWRSTPESYYRKSGRPSSKLR